MWYRTTVKYFTKPTNKPFARKQSPMLRVGSHTLMAMVLSIIAAISAAQATGFMPSLVSADNKISIQLLPAPTSTQSAPATGTVEVNLQSGETKIELKNASPGSAYLALFASSASSAQLGVINTDNSGDGSVNITLSAGTYVGVFQVTRVGLLQFVSVDTTFTIGVTASLTTTASSNETSATIQTTSTETSTTTVTGLARLQVDPPLRTISAGAFAKFDINIHVGGTANVLLTARSVPTHSVAIFTQNMGTANPDFNSVLTILTSLDTPAGTYGITLIALIDGQQYESQIGLEVTASSTETSTQITSAAVGLGLSITINTDQHSYQPNATVNLQGQVTDDTGSAVADASVSVQVDAPTGVEVVFITNLKTDSAGVFQVSFLLPASATSGTYTAFTTASKGGFVSATTHTTFVVGVSSTPSVVIRDVYATDISGTRTATFTAGQTVLIWVIVENSGAAFQGVIWVQIRDPNGTPTWIQFQISQLGTGQTVKIAFGFTITTNMAAGIYTANALVSDKLISQGGTFLASGNTEFALTA